MTIKEAEHVESILKSNDKDLRLFARQATKIEKRR